MHSRQRNGRTGVALLLSAALLLSGCQAPTQTPRRTSARLAPAEFEQTLVQYQAAQRGRSAAVSSAAFLPARVDLRRITPRPAWSTTLLLSTASDDDVAAMADAGGAGDTEGRGGIPAGYWRRNVWHQMGRESLNLVQRDLWDAFGASYIDVENLLILTGTLGASIAIRETGVDGTIRNRTNGNRQLGDFDEPIQLLGHPGTHFAAAGVLWLGSALHQDFETHEFSRSLAQALVVNGISTMALKVSANTTAPNGDEMAWPSGHTSSAFTVAAVVSEYYGPLAGVPALALAGLVGYQRIDSRVHDFSDVVFGAMLGYVVGSSIARENRLKFPEVFGLKVIPYTDAETGAAGVALFGTID